MEYYIQTRGEEADYLWVKVGAIGVTRETPPDFTSIIPAEFLSGTHFSLVLCWLDSGQLFLLVKNLSTARTDFRERRIRNTLVCLADPTEEKLIRGITAHAIEGQLENILSQVIQATPTTPIGFEVNISEFNRELANLTASKPTVPTVYKEVVLGKNDFDKLVPAELLKANLPTATEFKWLVVSSRNLAQTDFEQMKVWRGCLDRTSGEMEATSFKAESPNSASKKKINYLPASILLATLLIILFLGLLFAGR